MMPQHQPSLPIDAVRAEIEGTLAGRTAAVLVAPPGAGKTTRVPLWLLDAEWLAGRKVVMLEPRRLAARGAAARMARTLGEKLGQTVGLRARLDTAVGPLTRIEVVTEGVFTRLILDDPMLDGVGAVLLDEFHERSLDADLALALALDCQRGLREDLRIVVMSATLDHARVAAMLGGAPVIECEGRMFPVETRYLGRQPQVRIEDQMVSAITRALEEEPGSVLAFLPGQGEIRRVAERLGERLRGRSNGSSGVDIAPLYGGLDMAEQDRAVAPSAPGRRKVVLATSIAETSLTIEGVRVVVDCGLARVPRYEPGAGLTRLETVRVSRAAADQRRGRAGRLEPGVCYRLWSEPETQSLPAHAEPEIRNADLTGLLIDCATWGTTDPSALDWLDPPPPGAVAAARAELLAAEAIDATGRLTGIGRGAARLPLPPRLAVMMLRAAACGQQERAAEIAAVLVERGLGGSDTDLAVRLSAFRSDRGRRAADMRRLAANWARIAAAEAGPPADRQSLSTAALLSLAYPDRIAKARDGTGQYLLANGRGARLADGDPLARAGFLVVAEMSGTAAQGRILLAAHLEQAEMESLAGHRIENMDEVFFDAAARQVRARRTRHLDAITLSSEPRKIEVSDASQKVLCNGIVRLGMQFLPWSEGQTQLRERAQFLHRRDPLQWPDLSDEALAASAGDWLLPFLAGKTALSEVSAIDLGHALDHLIGARLRQEVEKAAPSHFHAPTGNAHRIDYTGPKAPSVSIRVQELFGLAEHPAVAGGLPLTFELLSPAHRPIQITRDLPGFWRGSWADVRAELRGRYPKHDWPENPLAAVPTTRTKARTPRPG
jgi:ATP-dependent helicase HrpB